MSDLDLVLQTLPRLGEADLQVVRSVVNATRTAAAESAGSTTAMAPPSHTTSPMDIIGLLADQPELADWISEEAMRQRELRPYFPRPTGDEL
ncbi:MAG: hypothetical protein ACRCT8_13810 [Lacipirellulaceae bacterium]